MLKILNMEMMKIKDLNKNQIIVLAVVAIIFVTTVGIYLYKTSKEKEDYDTEDFELIENIDEPTESVEKQILVHVTGEVQSRGVVMLKEGARIIDAIEACGGETEEADLNKINLAYVLNDGDKLYVPSVKDKEDLEYISSESGNNVIVEGAGGKMDKTKSLININTATKEQLTTLNGIGESIAEKIIQYRKENGKFNTVEDIKKVPGIGDSKFNSIKDKITV